MPVTETLYLNVGPALASLKTVDAAFTKATTNFGSGLAKATSQLNLQQLGSKLSGFGSTLTRNVTTPIAAAGAGAIFFASQFESSMAKIVGLSGLSGQAVEGMKQKVLDLAGSTATAPKELADALYFITSAGYSGAAALSILETSAKASASGLGETQVIADALTSVISAYGRENITAAKAADILTASVKFGKAEASELAAGIGNLAPLASQLGVGFDDLGASIAALTMVGVDTDTAFTNMKAIFSGLLKVTPQTADALAEVGLSAEGLRKTLAEPQGVLKVLRTLDTAFKGNEDAMAAVFPNIRALTGALGILAQDGARVDKVFQGVEHATGNAGRAFDVAAKTSAFKFKQGLADLQVVAIELGNKLLPIATQIVGVVSDMAAAFAGLPDFAQTFILGGAAAAAMVGPLLKVAAAALTVVGGFQSIGGMAGIIGALPAAFGPVGIAIAAVGVALAIAFDASAVNEFEVAIKGAGDVLRDEILKTQQVNSIGTASWVQNSLKQKGSLDQVNSILARNNLTFQQYYDALLTASDGTGQWANQLGLTAEEAYALQKATGSLDQSLQDAQQSALNQAQVTGNLGAIMAIYSQGLATASHEVTQFAAANNGLLPKLSDMGLAFGDAAAAAKAHGDAVKSGGGDMAAVAGVYQSYRANLIDQLTQLGYTRAEAELYSASLLQIPPDVQTFLGLDDGTAQAQLGAYLGSLSLAETQRTTILDLVMAGGAQAGELQKYIDQLNLTEGERTALLTAIDLASPEIEVVDGKLRAIAPPPPIPITVDDQTGPGFTSAQSKAGLWTSLRPTTPIGATDTTPGLFATAETRAAGWTALAPTTPIGATDTTGGPFGSAEGRASSWVGRNPKTGIHAQDNASGVIDHVIGRANAIPRDININIRASVSGTAAQALSGAGSFAKAFGVASGGVVGQGRLTGFAKGGVAVVGERGPEIVWLPHGSRVVTAAQSKAALGGGGMNIQVGPIEVHGVSDPGAARAAGDMVANGVVDGLVRRRLVLAGRG